ncbi:plasmid recombination protein (plasmid) [Crinalium epipsammum PCC 9333]|uniref:Plasmid recombination protein n=1 Tax=Crinalium epipsammum PCC 9333 TaxID=1173022 RepID=K9W803_9CYAN|nr:MobV family relaxase [Crinalium epipsammum]AFZ15575.1 plasmid recombination protein [Crinalium epipsammum PCC 9333]
MAYGICRIQKIKSWGDLAGSVYHTTRERETLNADPAVDNIRVIGQPNDPDLATMVLDKIGDQTIRKNAVLAVEMLLSASPEYFRPDEPSSAGVYEQEQLEAWTKKSVDWLKEQYQDRVVSAELHLDESTPHIHAYLVPLDDQGKLNCRALFGGSRHTLSKLQDSYAEAVKPLGLERGIKGSQATYTEVKQYYSDVNRNSLNLDLEEQLPQPLKNEGAAEYKERVIENLQPSLDIINHQLSDYSKAIKQKEEMERTARASEKERQKLEQRVDELESEVIKLRSQVKQLVLDDAIETASTRPPVITSQNLENSTATGSTDGDDDDDDNNETIGAIAPTHTKKLELPGQLPSLPELELELESGNDEAANSDEATNDDDEKLNYADIFAVPDDFDQEWILQQHREQVSLVRAKRAAEEALHHAQLIEYKRAEEQRIRNIFIENSENPIFNELLSDEARALFKESIAQENMGATAPNELQSNDATAPENASSFNHQTNSTVPTVQHQTDSTDPTNQTVQHQTVQHDPTYLSDQTVPTEPYQDDDDQTDDESVNVDPIEENWQPLRSYLIEECCLPSDLLDGLHEKGWVYANNEGMAVFTLRTRENIETGVCVFDPESESNIWRDLNLDPEVEQKVNGEPSFFWIPPQNDLPINDAILTSDPIETISRIALDPSFGQNSTLYLSTENVDFLPIEVLQKLEENVVVSLKGDEDGKELANEIMKALPKSHKIELNEAGWNGILQEQERKRQAEQMQLIAQYQSQQESQMEL